jgi:hypothetical protein
METAWRLFQKLKIELSYDPAIALLGVEPKECQSGHNNGTCTPCLLQHYSQDAPLVMNGLRKCGI